MILFDDWCCGVVRTDLRGRLVNAAQMREAAIAAADEARARERAAFQSKYGRFLKCTECGRAYLGQTLGRKAGQRYACKSRPCPTATLVECGYAPPSVSR